MVQRRVHSKLAETFDAMAYGPVGFAQSALVGFISASVAFLIGDASVKQRDVVHELPVFLLIAAAGTLAGLLVAVAVNYAIGRRIRAERELQKRVHVVATDPSKLVSSHVSGFDKSPANSDRTANLSTGQAA